MGGVGTGGDEELACAFRGGAEEDGCFYLCEICEVGENEREGEGKERPWS